METQILEQNDFAGLRIGCCRLNLRAHTVVEEFDRPKISGGGYCSWLFLMF
jgi:hypothetical protein